MVVTESVYQLMLTAELHFSKNLCRYELPPPRQPAPEPEAPEVDRLGIHWTYKAQSIRG